MMMISRVCILAVFLYFDTIGVVTPNEVDHEQPDNADSSKVNKGVALVDVDELRLPQEHGTAEEGEKEKKTEKQPQDLEHLIKEEEAAPSKIVFSDRRVNIRSQKQLNAVNYMRNKVINQLNYLRSGLLEDTNRTLSSPDEIISQIESLNQTIRDVNDTFTSWLKSSSQLQSVLERNYTSVEAVVELQKLRSAESKKQLEQLQIQAIREENKLRAIELNERKLELLAKAKNARLQDQNKGNRDTRDTVGKQIDAVLEGVGDKAESLRKKLEEPAFLRAQKDLKADLLTVVRVSEFEEEDTHAHEKSAAHQKLGLMSHLVDAENNQYVLSKPKDSTIMPTDLDLLHDVIIILTTCFVMGFICNFLKLPALIGYVCAGTIVGPAGYNVITSLVQVSALGEFGVFFVLFTLGLEFSITRLQEMWRLAVFVGSTMLIGTIFAGVAVGLLLQRSLTESLFVSVCIALSSTTVVVNSLTPQELETTYGRGLLAVLLMQDVYLGAIVAATSLVGSASNITLVDCIWLTGRLIGSLIVVILFAATSSKYILPKIVGDIGNSVGSVKMLGLLSICFSIMSLTDLLGVSTELGCFVAGVMISASQSYGGSRSANYVTPEKPVMTVHGLISIVQPVQDLFLAIFLASVGMHLYPTFLLSNSSLLIVLTLGMITIKYSASLTVWLLVWRSDDIATGHLISTGLAQVSEFGFVLASRGVRYGFLTVPVYFLLLSVAGLSLLLSPLLFYGALRTVRFFPRRNHQGRSSPT